MPDADVADACLKMVQAMRYLLDDDLKLLPLSGRRPGVGGEDKVCARESPYTHTGGVRARES